MKDYRMHLAAGLMVSLAGVVLVTMNACSSVTCEDDLTCAPGTQDGGDSSTDQHVPDARQDGHRDGAKDVVTEGAKETSVNDGEAGGCTAGAAPAVGGCITNSSGVFVSAAGKDKPGDGTMSSPFATISYALDHLGGATAIYVCASAGGYTDQIPVTVPVSIYGGLSCTGSVWTFAKGTVSKVTGTSPDFVLKIDGVSGAVDVEDLQLDAPNASTAGGSSIAGWVDNSTNVTFERVVLNAGQGQPGQDQAADGGSYSVSAPAGNPGTSSVGGAAQAPGACANGSGTSTGGTGGNPATGGQGGTDGTPPISPVNPAGHDGLGGTVAFCLSLGLPGDPGSYGLGGDGGAGALTYGTLTATAWMPSAGAAGLVGAVAQGGGGGASTDGSGGGGGGGAGGCGGSAGSGGTGGGSSLALVVVGSTVTLTKCTLKAMTAGSGGVGGGGEIGQLGGVHGSSAGAACNGGTGGIGGSGGGGGGGAGGLSAGVLWTTGSGGVAPTIDGTSVSSAAMHAGITVAPTPALGGSLGMGGAAGGASANAGLPGTAGTNGVAQAVLGI
jgi:hypothetical protein